MRYPDFDREKDENPCVAKRCGIPISIGKRMKILVSPEGAVAQSVEQRTENPCVGGSIPPHTTFDLRSFSEGGDEKDSTSNSWVFLFR